MFSHRAHGSFVPLAVAGATVVLLGVAGLVWSTGEPPRVIAIAPSVPVANERDVASTIEPVVVLDAEIAEQRAASPAASALLTMDVMPRSSARLRILDTRGSPIRNARVALHDASGRIVAATSDAEGRADVDVAVGEAVFVAARNRMLARALCEQDEDGAHSVVLEDGGTIAGRVEVDGQEPRECVALRVDLSRSLGVPSGLTAALDEALGHPTRTLDSLSVLTETDGTFVVAGLPHDARGKLFAVDWSRLSVDAGDGVVGHACSVAAGATNVLVRFTRLPAVCFRVIDRDGVPIAGLSLTSEITFESGLVDFGKCATDSNGRADVGVGLLAGDAAIERVVVDGFDEVRGTVHVESTGPWRRRTDLGDITIEPARAVTLVVRDEQHEPIAGARAFLDRRTGLGSPADADGAIELAVPRDAAHVLVAAAGFAIANVDLAAAADDVEVNLRRDTVLRVMARAPDGSPVSGMHVEITGARAAFTAPCMGVSTLPGMPAAFVSATSGMSGAGMVLSLTATTDECGEAVVRRLPAGTELTCTVREYPASVGSTSSVVLEPGVERLLDVGVPRHGWALRVRVANEAGAVLPGADVDVNAGANTIVSAVTDVSGECTLAVFGDDVTAFVGRDGYSIECFDASRALDAKATRTITLQLERSLDVFVTTARGSPIKFAKIAAVPIIDGRAGESRLVSVDSHEDGLHRVRSLGACPVSITIDVGGWKTQRFVDTTTTVLRVVLDDTGSVIVPPANLGEAAWDSAYAFVDRDGRETQRFPAWWFPENEAFELGGIRSGEYEVRLVHVGAGEATVAVANGVSVSAGAIAPLQLVAARQR